MTRNEKKTYRWWRSCERNASRKCSSTFLLSRKGGEGKGAKGGKVKGKGRRE